MSTDNKEHITVVSEAETEKEAAPEKKKFFTANRIEIIVAIFLGITALLTAWATWIGSLHGGNQATNYTKSNNLAAEGNSEYNAEMQLYLSDMMAWNTAIDYQIDAEVARMKGEEAEAQVYENKMEAYINQNCSKIMAEAITKMDKNMTSPFEVEGTVEKYFETSNKINADSQALLEEGKYPDVPVITGYTSDEFTFGGVNIVEKSVKRAVGKAMASEKALGKNANFYCYCFDPSIPGEDNPGTFHSVDLWFWFESIQKCWRPFKGKHFDLAREMCNYFANFVKTGDPNGLDSDGTEMPKWEAYDPDKENILRLKEQ